MGCFCRTAVGICLRIQFGLFCLAQLRINRTSRLTDRLVDTVLLVFSPLQTLRWMLEPVLNSEMMIQVGHDCVSERYFYGGNHLHQMATQTQGVLVKLNGVGLGACTFYQCLQAIA